MPRLSDAHSRWLANESDLAVCRDLIRNGSRSFYTASLILPPRLRADASVLYAFCRLSDDTVDSGQATADAIARLRLRLADAYAARPRAHAVDRAFCDLVVRSGLPRALPEALLEGLSWDVEGRRYETLSDVYAYAARVAGSVGAMMAVLMGVRSPALLARACDLGVAMQLTNIARDVGEDARMGRLYLPRVWLKEAGLNPEAWLRSPTAEPAIRLTVKRLLDAADALYRRADQGIAQLPHAYRPGIAAARVLYHAIGGEIARRDFDSVTQRARVPAGQKLRCLVQALASGKPAQTWTDAPALPENEFLIAAVTLAPAAPLALPSLRRRVSNRVVWVAELLATLDERSGMRERA